MGGKGAYYKAKYGGGGKGGKGSKGEREEEGGGGDAEDFNERDAPWSSANTKKSSREELGRRLSDLEGRQYPAYRSIEGTAYKFHDGPGYNIIMDRAQSDPYAPIKSKMRIFMSAEFGSYPASFLTNKIRRVALADYLIRRFWEEVHNIGLDEVKQSTSYHSAKGGELTIEKPSQHVLERSSAVVFPSGEIELRFQLSLPARGRTILGEQCAKLMCDTLPRVINKTLPAAANHMQTVQEHLDCVEDQEHLRQHLPSLGLVAFIANGSILPRRGGDDDRPMETKRTSGGPVAFLSPPSLEIAVTVPHRGEIRGMGIKPGVTLIVGGGFHGKSTLLRSLEVGVYNHIPGDGREFVVSVPDAVKIRAEDKRAVQNVDISCFLNNLPMGKETTTFTTQDASGSTSQAANIMEALEIGASCLLIDEDTCATNFMIRDRRMQLLVSKDKEPITPFILKVRQLYEEFGTSTICVVGGAGDYLEVADHVVMMDSYLPKNVTDTAKDIVKMLPNAMTEADRKVESGESFGKIAPRIPSADGITSCLGPKAKVVARNATTLNFGSENIDMGFVEQIVEKGQLTAIGDYLQALVPKIDKRRTLREVIEMTEKAINSDHCGLDHIRPSWMAPGGGYTRPRPIEVAAAVNRLRTMNFTQKRA
eukprot:TRINITY_DN9229_c0_g1_i1.p1 TRINITY_DN9229_c0_g1~~TRINITY_DN9229_c0_g1_i1.p1  ORF type:complete len:694 (+),score=200.98 TRINITY_DN9229_c0_g1_i1:136-2082(+)